MREYERTHPWLTFQLDLRPASYRLWVALGEACSKCEHLAGVPLRPAVAAMLHSIFLARGVHATTAIEGNTLSEAEVQKRLEGELPLPSSREYLGKEVDNVLAAVNVIAEHILHGAGPELGVGDVCEYNRLVLKGLELAERVAPGDIRTYEVAVAGYTGAPAQDCRYLLDRLCQWLNGDALRIPDLPEMATGILKAVVAHLYIAWIHPFGDGNGRTARLVEFLLLVSAGVPSVAAHLLSNHYNLTRQRYYQYLAEAGQSSSGVLRFIEYALQGFVDGLKEQLLLVREQQLAITWRDYVHWKFGDRRTMAQTRRRDVVLKLSGSPSPVPREQIPDLSPSLARAYAGKTPKTISRDMNALVEMGVVERVADGYRARRETILAFLPARRRALPEGAERPSLGIVPPTTPSA